MISRKEMRRLTIKIPSACDRNSEGSQTYKRLRVFRHTHNRDKKNTADMLFNLKG